MIGRWFKKVWAHPLAASIDINGSARFGLHQKIIRENLFLSACYRYWYRECGRAYKAVEGLPGLAVEIGCGAGFLESEIPNLVKTDCMANPLSHKIVDGQNMDFADRSLQVIFAVGVLHHMQMPARFFAEANRCLVPGGRLVLIEPTANFIQRILCKLLDHYEFVDTHAPSWENLSAHTMSGANLALATNIFIRDRPRFEREFPQLKIQQIDRHTFLRYIVSGGMSYRSFLPSFLIPLVELLEWLAKPFMFYLGNVMTIILVKK